MIRVWGRKTSGNVQIVMWCLAELGLKAERIDAGLQYGVTDTPEYLAMNPNGTVPTIQDGDNPPLWESAAILRYLVNNYESGSLWPLDPIERANVDRWAEWSKLNFGQNFSMPIFWCAMSAAPAQRDNAGIAAALKMLDKTFNIAEAEISQKGFLASENLTLADLQFGLLLYRYFTLDIERSDRSVLKAYYDKLCQLPNYREHVMVPYDEMRRY